MKRIIIMAVAILLMAGSTLMAQTRQGNRPPRLTEEQISQKLALRMARHLQLDEDKTAKFTPIYVEYRNDLKQVWEKYSSHPKMGKPAAGEKQHRFTEEELKQINANRFARSRATIDVEENYYKRFLTVLTQQQYDMMLKLEKMHLQRMKNERMKRMQQYKPQPKRSFHPGRNTDARQRKVQASENLVSSIENTPSQEEKKSDRWMSMSGAQLDGIPTTSGIYINGGKKVMIK